MRQTDRETDRQTGRQAGRQADRDRHKEKHIEVQNVDDISGTQFFKMLSSLYIKECKYSLHTTAQSDENC